MTMHGAKRRLLGPDEIPPSHPDWEVIGAFNPGVAVVAGHVVVMVRVAERPRERRPGYVPLPRWDAAHGRVIDWTPEGDLEPIDPRVVRLRATGLVRLTFVSHLRVLRCREDGWAIDPAELARFEPQAEWEEYGVEDPRITWLDDCFWITYVAVSRHGAATALAATRDFRSFERHGIIFPPENKDVVLFPERIGGQYVALHRPNGATPFTRPEMWIARSDDLIHWGRHEPLVFAGGEWESGRVGAGVPPLRVADGWLEIYHGNRRPTRPGEVGCYQAAALLLDPENPARVVRRTVEPILAPTEPFERRAFVPEVVFPTGAVERGDAWLVYYGAGDTHTAVAELPRRELLARLAP